MARDIKDQVIDKFLSSYIINKFDENYGGYLSETKLQKLIFLSEKKLIDKRIKALNYNYIKFYHGPFSNALRNDIATFAENSLIEEPYLNSSNTILSEYFTDLEPYYFVFYNSTDQKTYGYNSTRWTKYADKIIKPGEVAMLRYTADVSKTRTNASGTFGLTLETGLNHIGHSYNGTRNLTWYNTTIASTNLSTIEFQYPENGTTKLYTYGSSSNGSVEVPQGFGVEVNVTAETVISGL